MSEPIFKSEEHRAFYETQMARVLDDSWHRAFFYLTGLMPETREHIDDLFSFGTDAIRPAALRRDWQNGDTTELCRLAFNLWSGHTEANVRVGYTPHALFASPNAPYYIEALKLNYPQFCRELKPQKSKGQER